MSLLIGFLTFVLVMNCLFLMLLILIQLPKKEAGAGIAFGGGTTDALFGAGSGNALTKVTKYSATFFVFLAVLLSTMNMHAFREHRLRLEQELQKPSSAPVAAPVTPKANLNPLPTQPTPTATKPAIPTTPSKLMTTIPSQPAATSAPAAAPKAEAPKAEAPAATPPK